MAQSPSGQFTARDVDQAKNDLILELVNENIGLRARIHALIRAQESVDPPETLTGDGDLPVRESGNGQREGVPDLLQEQAEVGEQPLSPDESPGLGERDEREPTL